MTEVTIWFDPVCPFAWNTARWLTAVAQADGGIDIDWQTMSLAVLNEGRELPPAHQARMSDSLQIGRLMIALRHELGSQGLAEAYFAFGERYFDQSAGVTEEVIDHVLSKVSAQTTTAASLTDSSLDALVRDSHQASQKALGETGGSPMLRIDGTTFFGPVLAELPTPDANVPLFHAVATLARTPQFSQLQRPRNPAGHPTVTS